MKPLYQFTFFFDGERGSVTVYPAAAFVKFGGAEFEIDAARGDLATAIWEARVAHARCAGRLGL